MTNEQNSKLNPQIDNIEIDIVKGLTKYIIGLTLIVAIILGFVMSLNASYSVVLAGAIVLANFYFSAMFIRAAARISPTALMVGMLGGFVLRLAAILLIALLIKNIGIFDFNLWLLSVAIGHVGVLTWETLRVSKTVAHPDVHRNV